MMRLHRLLPQMFRSANMADTPTTLDDILPPARKKPLTDLDFISADGWDIFDRVREGLGNFEEDGFYTPDMPQLLQQDFHNVFVYGSLREGFSNHRFMSNSRFVGYGVTTASKWVLTTVKGACPYPVALLTPRKDRQGRIFGEVYKVRPSTMRRLDCLESNGSIYKRWLTNITVATDDKGGSKSISCWMYRGILNYWSTRTDRLRICKRYKPNNREADPYYVFSENLEF